MAKKTAAEQEAAEAVAAEEQRRRIEIRRMRWAAVFLAAVALFAAGYAAGQGSVGGSVVSGDTTDEPPPVSGDIPGSFPDRFPCSVLEMRPGARTLVLECTLDRSLTGGPDDDVSDEAGFLGVSVRQVPRGVVVVGLADDSPAAEAGVEHGDVIVAVDGIEVESPEHLGDLVADAGAGTEVEITLRRLGDEVTVEVVLAGRPA